MTTARTHKFQVGRMAGVARPLPSEPKADDYVPVSAEAFLDGESGQPTIEDDLTEGIEGTEFGTVAFDATDAGTEGQFDPANLDFDPAEHNVDDVKAYVEAHPETADAILELELNGKGRSGVMSFLENFDPEGEG